MFKDLPADNFLFSSESVSRGHPDKLCDYVSDSILDACLTQDPNSKVACEAAVKNQTIMVFGEISTKGSINYEQIVRQAIKEIGFDSIEKGFDYKSAQVIIAIDTQSPEIANGVHVNKKPEDIGAGDQGLMIGYATNETPEYMPMTHFLCNQLIMRMHECREQKLIHWMLPDGKVQVTIQYKKDHGALVPIRVHTILISQQHINDVSNETIRADLKEHVIKKVIPANLIDDNTQYFLNPSEKFCIGGPHGDAGLTGRKIIVDTYGGWGGHGGGAFSGKDSTKVDRSGAYAVRQVAKSLVANDFCKRCMVQVAYSIGVANPLSIHVDTYGTITEGYTERDLENIVDKHFDLRPGMLIKNLKLNRPIFKKTSVGGHFGRRDDDFTWENIVDLSHAKKK